MVNWRSLIVRLPGMAEVTGLALTSLLSAATFIAVGYAWRRPVEDQGERARGFLCFTAAGLLVSYHSHYQDMAILLPPGLAVLALARVGRGMADRRPTALSPGTAMRWFRRWIRSESARHSKAVAVASGVLLVGVPSTAWLLAGLRALARIDIWSALALPGLVLLCVALCLPRLFPPTLERATSARERRPAVR